MDLRPSRGSRISRTFIFLTLLLAASRVQAQTDSDRTQAQALQVAGVRLMDHGDNRAAIEKFQAAFRLVPSPKILFNLGKAQHAVGHEVEAVTALARFLDEAPYALKESREEAQRLVDSLRPKLSYLDLATDDADSSISVDGEAVGVAPLPRPVIVTPGAHEVRFEKPGMTAETRSVSPVAGQKLRIFVKLSPASAPTPVTATPPVNPVVTVTEHPTISEPPTVTRAAAPPPDVPVVPASSTERPWQITAAWISGGAAVAFLAGGIAAQIASSSKNADFNSVTTAPQSPNGQCNKTLPDDGGGPCSGLLDAASSRQTLAVVGFVASGLALAGSLVFYLAAPSRTTAGHEAAVACLPSGERPGMSCVWSARF
jgi:hypothetical protein